MVKRQSQLQSSNTEPGTHYKNNSSGYSGYDNSQLGYYDEFVGPKEYGD